jgi:hypothetical protein
MIPMIQAQMMILDQMMMKTKAKRVKSQQKNNKRQLKRNPFYTFPKPLFHLSP